MPPTLSLTIEPGPPPALPLLPPGREWISYVLFLRLERETTLEIGRLGNFRFAAGEYRYIGSARKNFMARVNRHLRRDKKLRWHIDYLLASPAARIYRVEISTRPECELVQAVGGEVAAAGFGASDCSAGCRSHLRRIVS